MKMTLLALAGLLIMGCSESTSSSANDNLLYNEIAAQRTARLGVRSLKEGCLCYYLQHKQMPKSLKYLVEGDDPIVDGGHDALYDPWGNKYEMEVKGKRVVVKSAGVNGVMGDEDDIRSDDKNAGGRLE